jgi:anti-anti-sigma factor
METAVEIKGDVSVIHITGSVDGLSAEDLQRVLSGEMEAGRYRLVGALADVDYTSSAGLRVLLGTMKDARSQSGDLRLAAPRADVLKVLKLSGFTGILKIFDTVDAAVESFGAREA